MSYVDPDYKSKKELKEAVIRRTEYLKLKAELTDSTGFFNPLSTGALLLKQRFPKVPPELRTYSPGPFGTKQDGEDVIEGPHYPKPHRWYARVKVEGGIITKVIS